MSREVLLLVDALAREKNVEKDIVFAALELALASATKKRFHDDAEVRVSIDRETGDYQSFRRWQIMADDTVEDPARQISMTAASQLDAGLQLGEFVEEPLEPVEVGRIGAQAAKQVIYQKIRDAEREQILNDFLERKEYMVSGTIKRMNGVMPSSSLAGLRPFCLETRRSLRRTCESVTVFVLTCLKLIVLLGALNWCYHGLHRNF
jgi:N utilization substance protein A